MEGGRSPTGVSQLRAAAVTLGSNFSSRGGQEGGKGVRKVEISPQGKEQPSMWAVSDVPNPQVLECPKRRKYTAEYKLKLLKEADLATEPGDTGALLRREGLYSSMLQNWRRQRERGELAGLNPKKRGQKPLNEHPALAKKVKRLETENRWLQKRLKHAELILDIQKKISEITGIPLKPIELEEED